MLPSVMGLTPDGRSLYVIGDRRNRRPGYLVPVSTSAGAVGHRIGVGRDPLAIAFAPGSRTAYVLCSPSTLIGDRLTFGTGSVFPVALAAGRAGKPVQTGRGSFSMAIVPGTTYQPVGATQITAGTPAAGPGRK